MSEVVVSATSGLLPTAFTKKTITELFLTGTEPRAFDEIDEYNATQTDSALETLKNSLLNNPDFNGTNDTGQGPPDTAGAQSTAPPGGTPSSGNPLLD